MSALDVVNEALVKLGAAPIASFEDAGAQASAARAIYRTTATRLMAETTWFWAMDIVRLPQLAGDVQKFDRYKYVYQLPTDNIRVIGMKNGRDFRILGDKLHTTESEVNLLYIKDVPEDRWPGYFRELVVDTLASVLAISVTDSSERAQIWGATAKTSRSRAMAIDAQQTPPDVLDLMRIYTRRYANPLAAQ